MIANAGDGSLQSECYELYCFASLQIGLLGSRPGIETLLLTSVVT